MKKGRMVLIHVLVIAVLLVKMAAVGEMFKLSRPGAWMPWGVGSALADSPVKAAAPTVAAPAPKDAFDDHLKKERDLYTLLEQRKKELDAREAALKAEEQRLAALKKEIVEKIDSLKTLEQKLSVTAEAQKTEENKRFKELAKVFEATPPAKVGPMLEKLDLKTAAGITMNMKRDKAGLIWGYLSPQRAVEITREITRAPLSSSEQ
ncbi:MAG TPA: hypothetical protein PLB96_05295 [Syntrophales bacterium]|nr:hypothetical protein [Syntrophales bacterium]